MLQDIDIADIECMDPVDQMDFQVSPDDPVENTMLRIAATMGLIGRMQKVRLDMDLAKVGLTSAQVQVLVYILRRSGREKEITAKELEDRFQVSNPTMSGILKRLEKKNFIERRPGSADKRNKQILIKGDAQQMRKMIEERIRQEKDRVFQGFTTEELERLLQLITKILHNLKTDRSEE